MLTNKHTHFKIGGTQSSHGVASYPAIKRCGKGVFLFIGQIIARVSSYREVWRRSPCELRVILGLFLFPKYSYIIRRQIMPKIWQPPQNADDAVNTLDMLSDLIQFVNDLTAMPSPPINEYPLSQDGYSGLYFFLCFIQDTIHDCQDAIHNKLTNSKGDER